MFLLTWQFRGISPTVPMLDKPTYQPEDCWVSIISLGPNQTPEVEYGNPVTMLDKLAMCGGMGDQWVTNGSPVTKRLRSEVKLGESYVKTIA